MLTVSLCALLVSCFVLTGCKAFEIFSTQPDTTSHVANVRAGYTGCVVYTSFDRANGAVGVRNFSGAVAFDYSIAINNEEVFGHITPHKPTERSDSKFSKDFSWTPKPFRLRGKALVKPNDLNKMEAVYKIDNVTLVLNRVHPHALQQIILVQDGIELKSWQFDGLGGKILPEKSCE